MAINYDAEKMLKMNYKNIKWFRKNIPTDNLNWNRQRRRETERYRDRQRETDRDRDRQRETEGDRERQRETERDRERHRQTKRPNDRRRKDWK